MGFNNLCSVSISEKRYKPPEIKSRKYETKNVIERINTQVSVIFPES